MQVGGRGVWHPSADFADPLSLAFVGGMLKPKTLCEIGAIGGLE
jgi:hypothetical protein